MFFALQLSFSCKNVLHTKSLFYPKVSIWKAGPCCRLFSVGVRQARSLLYDMSHKIFGFWESNSPYNFGTTQARIMNIICIHQMFPTLFGLAEIWFANYCKTHSGFTSSYTTMWLQQYKKLHESIANVFRRHQSVFCRSSTTTMIVQGADFLAED